METYDSYVEAWVATQDLDADQLEDLQHEDLFFSLDLSEATYRMPFSILDIHTEMFDRVMEDFRPYQVFNDLFKTHGRIVLTQNLIDKGYWYGEPVVESKQGSFMGDGMSFIHLTLMLGSLTRAACAMSKCDRPLGQSVGDDLFTLRSSFKFCMNFMRLASSINCEFSKINSISKDAATFCEQFMCKITDLNTYSVIDSFKDSIFHDLVFVDCIKGSTLAGRSKVKADKADPFIGHATLLSKQIAWNPIQTIKKRAPVFLWARNYRSAVGLGIKYASLPHALGGLRITVGNSYEYGSSEFQEELLPYFESMLTLETKEFCKYYTLLQGILRANPKGFSYQNDWEKIQKIVSGCTLYTPESIGKPPEYIKTRSGREQFYREQGFYSFNDLAAYIARMDAFQKHWDMIQSKTYLSLPVRDARRRVNHALAIVKSNLTKSETRQSSTMDSLAVLFEQKISGLYIRKDEPSILETFGGMPTLEMDFS